MARDASESIPEPPEDLDDDQAAAWRLAFDLLPLGELDVEPFARLLRYRALLAQLLAADPVDVAQVAKVEPLVARLEKALGATPEARRALRWTIEAPKDPAKGEALAQLYALLAEGDDEEGDSHAA